MKKFSSNIKIDGSSLAALMIEIMGSEMEKRAVQKADEYEEETYKLLSQINQRKTGKVLLQAINRLANKTMIIMPKIEVLECDTPEKVNAYAEPVSGQEQHAIKKGKKRWGPTGIYYGDGTGLGSDTNICFTPYEWVSDDIKSALGLNPPQGFLPDDMLVHEMVHGLRIMAGVKLPKRKRIPFQKKYVKYEKKEYDNPKCAPDKEKVVEFRNNLYVIEDAYRNIEEWFAVLIQNIFRSECHRPLRDAYTTSFGNFTEKQFIRLGMNRSHMRQLRRENREFFRELRKIDVEFNPTRRILAL